jgi:hypothetical protein
MLVFKIHLAEMGIFNFPFIWHFNTYIAAILKLFFIVIVSMMANEYMVTLKQNLIDGLSKRSSFCLNFDRTSIFFCSTVFVFVMSLILGFVFSSYTELSIVFSGMEYLVAFFVKLVGFFSFFVCFRHTGKAICICPRVSSGMEHYRRNCQRF